MRKNHLKNICYVFLALLTSCHYEPVYIYPFNVEQKFGTSTVKVVLDEEKEMFVVSRRSDDNPSYSFNFYIYSSSTTDPSVRLIGSVNNPDYFTYSCSTGEKVTFDDTGYYMFSSTYIEFYISYASSSEGIKKELSYKAFYIEVFDYTWSPQV